MAAPKFGKLPKNKTKYTQGKLKVIEIEFKFSGFEITFSCKGGVGTKIPGGLKLKYFQLRRGEGRLQLEIKRFVR